MAIPDANNKVLRGPLRLRAKSQHLPLTARNQLGPKKPTSKLHLPSLRVSSITSTVSATLAKENHKADAAVKATGDPRMVTPKPDQPILAVPSIIGTVVATQVKEDLEVDTVAGVIDKRENLAFPWATTPQMDRLSTT